MNLANLCLVDDVQKQYLDFVTQKCKIETGFSISHSKFSTIRVKKQGNHFQITHKLLNI